MDILNIFLQSTPPADFTGYLLWSVGALVGAIGVTAKLLHSSFQERLKEKDKIIDRQAEELTSLQLRYEKIILDLKDEASENIKLTDLLLNNIKDANSDKNK